MEQGKRSTLQHTTMSGNTNAQSVNAEISINDDGQIYVGIEAREKLGVGYNDQVRVTVENSNGNRETFTGFLNAANRLSTSRDAYRRLGRETRHGKTKRVDAIVEPSALSWEDFNGMTEQRFDGHDTLDSR